MLLLSPSFALKHCELQSNNGELAFPIIPFAIVAYPSLLLFGNLFRNRSESILYNLASCFYISQTNYCLSQRALWVISKLCWGCENFQLSFPPLRLIVDESGLLYTIDYYHIALQTLVFHHHFLSTSGRTYVLRDLGKHTLRGVALSRCTPLGIPLKHTVTQRRGNISPRRSWYDRSY